MSIKTAKKDSNGVYNLFLTMHLKFKIEFEHFRKDTIIKPIMAG